MSTSVSRNSSIDPEEAAYFERLAHRWWDAGGPFWPLHRLNAFRVDYIRRHLSEAFGRDASAPRPLAGLRLLDIGCGGGILSESLARLGAEVTGIDIVSKNIRVAELHAQSSGLQIAYRLATAEQLVAEGAELDAVLNMEVIEHVENLPGFLADCGRLVRPGGLMAVASINRTLAAYLIAILGAERILRWLPAGTHHYRKLVRPSEVVRHLGDGLVLLDQTGVRINPVTRRFSYTRWMGVNYMQLFRRRDRLP